MVNPFQQRSEQDHSKMWCGPDRQTTRSCPHLRVYCETHCRKEIELQGKVMGDVGGWPGAKGSSHTCTIEETA